MSTPKTRKSFDNETSKAIGRRIRAARKDMTQEEFAEAIGVSRSALTNYEAGRRLPNDLTLKRIGEVAGVTEPELLFGATETPFKEYRAHIDAYMQKQIEKNPGFIPRFMISDEEYAIIALLRLIDFDQTALDIVRKIADYARKELIEDPPATAAPIAWGMGYLERVDEALKRGWLEHGFDPEQSFWMTFWEEVDKRPR